MTTRIKLRRDTAANWTLNNPTLAAGEPGLETDTGKTKYGDGTTAWASLDYATGGITAREQVGYFNFHGAVPNDANTDWWFEGVETDPAGNAYYVGAELNWNSGPTQWPRVVKVNPQGEMQWQKAITWADGFEGDATSAVYNTATDQLVVVAQMRKTAANPEMGAAVITMNPDTGAIVGNPVMIRDEVTSDGSGLGAVDPSDIILDANDNPIVVGHKDGSASIYALTTTSVGTTDAIFVNSAIFTDKIPTPYNNWYITGTNIGSEVSITNINRYENQPATGIASTGTGATFSITADGAGGYTLNSVANGGSNYSVNNKILILGSNLGGVDGVNDITITVNGVSSGAIITASGNAVSTGTSTYSAVSGTNIVSGSNATIGIQWRINTERQAYFPDYTERFGAWVIQSGSGYALGDTLFLNPEQYGGSTSATITVTSVGGSGEIDNFAFTGTFNTSTIKLMTGNSVDFSTTGSWRAVNYSAEAFIWTQGWAKTIGDSGFDKINAVDKDSQGNIYLACQTYDISYPAPWGYGADLPMLVKLDSNGNQLWAKKFSPDWFVNDNDGYSGVVVDSNDDIIVVEDELVTKVSSTGTVIWQKYIGWMAPMDMWNTCVDIDSDDNIYVASEYDSIISNGDDFLIVKFDTNGNVLWQRAAGTSSDEDTNWDNGYQILSVNNGQVYIAGSSYQGNDDSAISISFPTDGSGAEAYKRGRFFLNTATWEVSTTTATVYNFTLAVTSTQVTVTNETNISATTTSTNNSTLAIRTGAIDGRIEDLYSLSFEDGSVQTTAYTGALIREENFVYNTNSFYPNLTHANRLMRWSAPGWNDSVYIYVPHNDDVPFPVGTQMHFVKEQGINSFMFWPWANIGNDNDIVIMPSSPADNKYGDMYDTSEGWSVRHPDYDQVPAKATLTKVDTNRWLLSCDSPTHIMDWSW